MSVVVVVVVRMKIATSGDLGICTRCNHDKLVDIGEKLVLARLKWLKMAYKSCDICSACLWFTIDIIDYIVYNIYGFTDHTHCASM